MTKSIPTKNLLIEIGCEDLPAKPLKKIEAAFQNEMVKALKLAELTFKDIKAFITPRRLALLITELSTQQPSKLVIKRGPAKSAAYDEKGKPTKAALGFAESCGVTIDALSLQETDKGVWLCFQQQTEGLTAEKLIPTILTDVLQQLPLGRRMRWGNHDYTFSRPIHWILLLLGNKAIHAEIAGVKTGNLTYGHRFHHPNAFEIMNPIEYEQILLNKGFVISDFERRQHAIKTQLKEVAAKHHAEVNLNQDLLEEVTGLVERPVVLFGSFDKSFLQVPAEALISAMETHQKCFTLFDKNHGLLPHFLITSNIESKHPKTVINGNEWVIRARLADAAFFYETDKKTSLQDRREGLKHVRFQKGLGSLFDKSERIAKLAKHIATEIHADPIATERAAHLCKTDLLTQMVGEFPELQGIMGRYYAANDGESESVARTIEEHYYPRFAQDILPSSKEGAALAIADRIDSLVGLFSLGKRPTGDKDPFSIRRLSITLLRILVEKTIDLDLKSALNKAKALYKHSLPNSNAIPEVLDFCFERFTAWYQEQGVPPRVFDAVFAKNLTNPLDFDQRIQAVKQFIELPESESLAAANKRVHNILVKSDVVFSTEPTVDTALLTETPEKNLWKILSHKEKELAPLLKTKQYTEALKRLASLREPIDQFFSDVMVMVEDQKIRKNRINLLHRLRTLFLGIADISLL